MEATGEGQGRQGNSNRRFATFGELELIGEKLPFLFFSLLMPSRFHHVTCLYTIFTLNRQNRSCQVNRCNCSLFFTSVPKEETTQARPSNTRHPLEARQLGPLLRPLRRSTRLGRSGRGGGAATEVPEVRVEELGRAERAGRLDLRGLHAVVGAL